MLPSPLTADTVHVHDLYFLALLEHLAPVITPHLRFAPVTDERHHIQRFRDSVANSLLRPDLAVGWDSGRRHQASLDQYVPFTAHVAQADGSTTAFGIMLADDTAWVDVERVGDLEFVVRAAARAGTVGLRIVGGQARVAEPDRVTAGAVEVQFADPPASITESPTATGHLLDVAWPSDRAELRITIADPR